MNDREKKLVMILVAAVFIIANVFAYTTYDGAIKKKEVELKTGAKELKLKQDQLAEAGLRQDEIDWLTENMPAEGTHASVRAELITFMGESATKRRLVLRRHPQAVREDPDEFGEFRSAVVKMVVNARDPELYQWLVELQNPKKSRAITRLKITPQRDDKTRIDCELEVTRWFTPILEEDMDTEGEGEKIEEGGLKK